MARFKKDDKAEKAPTGEPNVGKAEKCECPPPTPNITQQQIGELKEAVSLLLEAVDISRKDNEKIRQALRDNMIAGRYGSYTSAIADGED